MQMASLATLLKERKDVISLLASNKVKCSITGHEMPPDAAVVTAHLNGKKFKKAMARRGDDMSMYLPYIVPDVENEKKMFCKLTAFSLNPIAAEIERHMKGKKFQRLKLEYDEKEEKKEQKLREKEERRKEREDMEKAGIWVPTEDMLVSDDEEDEEEGKGNDGDRLGESDKEDEGNEMDEGEEDDEGEEEDSDDDWIITSPKLDMMKKQGIADEDEDEVMPLPGMVSEKNEKKGASKKRAIGEATTKKKASGRGSNGNTTKAKRK